MNLDNIDTAVDYLYTRYLSNRANPLILRPQSKSVGEPFLRNFYAGIKPSSYNYLYPNFAEMNDLYQNNNPNLYKAIRRPLYYNKRLCPWEEKKLPKYRRNKKVNKNKIKARKYKMDVPDPLLYHYNYIKNDKYFPRRRVEDDEFDVYIANENEFSAKNDYARNPHKNVYSSKRKNDFPNNAHKNIYSNNAHQNIYSNNAHKNDYGNNAHKNDYSRNANKNGYGNNTRKNGYSSSDYASDYASSPDYSSKSDDEENFKFEFDHYHLCLARHFFYWLASFYQRIEARNKIELIRKRKTMRDVSTITRFTSSSISDKRDGKVNLVSLRPVKLNRNIINENFNNYDYESYNSEYD